MAFFFSRKFRSCNRYGPDQLSGHDSQYAYSARSLVSTMVFAAGGDMNRLGFRGG